jgi:DNA-directed RNA polymerase alpha subunit
MSKQRTEAEKAAAIEVMSEISTEMRMSYAFGGRGFSQRTLDALHAHGIKMPEELLFISEAAVRKIPGIGKAAFEEIMRYRARCTQLIPQLQPTQFVKPDKDAL